MSHLTPQARKPPPEIGLRGDDLGGAEHSHHSASRDLRGYRRKHGDAHLISPLEGNAWLLPRHGTLDD